MSFTYATAAEYTTEAPNGLQTPPQLERLLAKASLMVRHATRHTRYPVTQTGVPSVRAQRDAVREATISQVLAWVEADMADVVLTGGATAKGRVESSAINGASVKLDLSEGKAGRARLLDGLCDEALMVLAEAGLTGGLPGIIR